MPIAFISKNFVFYLGNVGLPMDEYSCLEDYVAVGYKREDLDLFKFTEGEVCFNYFKNVDF